MTDARKEAIARVAKIVGQPLNEPWEWQYVEDEWSEAVDGWERAIVRGGLLAKIVETLQPQEGFRKVVRVDHDALIALVDEIRAELRGEGDGDGK